MQAIIKPAERGLDNFPEATRDSRFPQSAFTAY